VHTSDIALLSLLGVLVWIVGTLYFANAGRALVETTSRLYWISFFAVPIISAAFCAAILWWRHIPPTDWDCAMLLLALPGMLGEAAVLSNFSIFMPKLRAASGGRYAALLFATYAVALAVAEVVTLKAR
jgi:hypothetical protein